MQDEGRHAGPSSCIRRWQPHHCRRNLVPLNLQLAHRSLRPPLGAVHHLRWTEAFPKRPLRRRYLHQWERGMSPTELTRGIRALKAARGAAILAHNYQRPEIQDLADVVADSLKMARRATELDAKVLVICGVHFMAETAAIANPDKRVLIPDLNAGCSLAATIQAADVRAWRAAHPDGLVVAYVNTAADVKAEADYCCTSGNAVAVIRSLPPDVPVLFLPDFFLGNYLRRVTGRPLEVWLGECHVHAGLTRETLEQRRAEYPDAEFLVHPERGCVTSAMYYAEAEGDVAAGRMRIASTGQMMRRAGGFPPPGVFGGAGGGGGCPAPGRKPGQRGVAAPG